MLTGRLPIKIENPDFPVHAIASVSPDSGAIVTIEFRRLDFSLISRAVLLPPRMEFTFRYESGTSLYFIMFPQAEVAIKFGYHVDTLAGRQTMLAFITTSNKGETMTRVHGLE